MTRGGPVADVERLTITLPPEMAAMVKAAVADGDYASASEVVREALRDWKIKRALQVEELAALKADAFVMDALGAQIAEWFIEAKSREWDEYRSFVHPWELDRYLPIY